MIELISLRAERCDLYLICDSTVLKPRPAQTVLIIIDNIQYKYYKWAALNLCKHLAIMISGGVQAITKTSAVL